MAIRLKNLLYNTYVKWLIGVVFLLSVAVLFNLYMNNLRDNDSLFRDTFYETEQFQEQYVRLSHNVVELHLELIDEGNIINNFDGDEVRLTRYRRILENLERGASFQYIFFDRLSGNYYTNVRDGGSLDSIKESLSDYESSVEWDQTGIYFSGNSVMHDQLYTFNEYIAYNGIYSSSVSVKDVISRLQYSDWVLVTAVNPDLMEDDYLFGNDYRQFMGYKAKAGWHIFVLFLMSYFVLLALIYFSVVSGKKSKESPCKLYKFDHLPIELQLFTIVIAYIPYSTGRFGNGYNRGIPLFLGTLVINNLYTLAVVLIVLLVYMSMVRTVKNDVFYQRSIIYRTVKTLYRFFAVNFSDAWDKMRILIIGSTFLITNGLIMFFGFSYFVERRLALVLFCTGAFLTFNYLWYSYVFRFYNEIKAIIHETNMVRLGESKSKINTASYQTAIRQLADDINELHEGLQIAVDEAVKGEKLKAELITNVTHDLKNPLTSITSYIDLLSYEVNRLEEIEAISFEEFKVMRTNFKNYTDVLTNKSNKLIRLIEDVISASKASSGNLDVHLQQIDIKQFVEQCLVEKEEALENHNLKVVVSNDRTKPCLAYGDPNHMFRVFENLLGNAIKYSLENTRIYITIEDYSDEEMLLTMKNISNHVLDVDLDTLTERFVRADESRTKDGFGLGLSIVDSLMTLQSGKLKLEVDGDLFKAKILLKKEV